MALLLLLYLNEAQLRVKATKVLLMASKVTSGSDKEYSFDISGNKTPAILATTPLLAYRFHPPSWKC